MRVADPRVVESLILGNHIEARYLLKIGRAISDTEYRPMYKGIIERKIRPVFLHPKYVDFPVKYAIVVRKGEKLPRSVRHLLVMKYTSEGIPIRWHEGVVKE